VDFYPGISLTIPTGTGFQFRNIGETPLKFIIAAMPPWPGEEEGKIEAQPLKKGYWETS
jgi:mannose-6-phosphate isomerase-like protein (cupin superfamily)